MASSRVRSLFASKVTLSLIILFVSLLITFAVVLGLVTIPNFKDKDKASSTSSSSNPALYAVIKQNFPDPCLIKPSSQDDHYAFATRNSKVNIQVASTNNGSISDWTYHENHDALPDPGKWVATQIPDAQVWAPSVMETPSGDFIMYYAALAHNSTRRHCLGAALSSSIMGPYIPRDSPLICNDAAGGMIDPAYFLDPATNTSYLIYKTDGNAIGVGGACGNAGAWPNTPTPVKAIELSSSDLTVTVGEPFELLTNVQSDGPNIESPTLWYHEYHLTSANGDKGSVKSYHIAFNSGCFHDESYRINHVICVSPADPSWDGPGSPNGIRDCSWHRSGSGGMRSGFARTLLKTGDMAGLKAPGGPSVATYVNGMGVGSGGNGGDQWKEYMIFHADVNDEWFEHEDVGFSEQVEKGWDRRRGMFVAELDYEGIEDMIRVGSLVLPDSSKES